MSNSEKEEKLDEEKSDGHQLEEEMVLDEHDEVVRKNKSYYGYKWATVQEPAKKNTWNWAAFFFTVFWLSYRKMYKPFILSGLATTLWMALFHFVDLSPWLTLVYYFGLSFILGWNGNRWYYIQTSRILERAKTMPERQQNYYIQNKGGTHLGFMIGLSILLFVFLDVADIGAAYLPTQSNVKNVVRLSDDGDTLDWLTDNSEWNYLKKTDRYYVVEFNGYDYSNDENVSIIFYVYLDKQIYDWKTIEINEEFLNEEEVDDYISWVEDQWL